ncbi:hypothetical protein D3C85_274450 [compost metagenome]
MKGFTLTGLFMVVVVFGFILSPMLSLWSLNTISEQAGMGWYVPHNFWTYLSVYGLAVVFKGGFSK